MVFVADANQGARGRGVAAPPAKSAKAAREYVVPSLELELGEGDARDGRFMVWPVDGSPALELPAGTRVERLQAMSWHERPAGVAASAWRIRVTGGKRAGLVAYSASVHVQAAR